MKKRVTIADVAAKAGVAKSTVSFVLNSTKTKVKISESTKQRVFNAVKETGYFPNASARALSSSRSGQIGFILSNTIAGGWTNSFFASIFQGIETVCHKYGYGVTASRYNISSLDSFIFPEKVAQKTVDGVIAAGYLEAEIANKFKEYGIPLISIGDDLEVSKLVPVVTINILEGLFMAVSYCIELGHNRIGIIHSDSRRSMELFKDLRKKVETSKLSQNSILIPLSTESKSIDYVGGKLIAQRFFNLSATERPSVVIGSDQAISALYADLFKEGIVCPRDISLVCSCDTALCKYFHPRLTAVEVEQEKQGETAAEMLIMHLDQKKPLKSGVFMRDYSCRLIIRESCIPRSTSTE